MNREDLDPSVLRGLRDKLGASVVDRLVVLFRENVNARRAALAVALRDDDRAAAEIAFHSIKGSAQIVGASRLEAISAHWEDRARDGEVALTDQALAEVTAAFQGAERALEAV